MKDKRYLKRYNAIVRSQTRETVTQLTTGCSYILVCSNGTEKIDRDFLEIACCFRVVQHCIACSSPVTILQNVFCSLTNSVNT